MPNSYAELFGPEKNHLNTEYIVIAEKNKQKHISLKNQKVPRSVQTRPSK